MKPCVKNCVGKAVLSHIVIKNFTLIEEAAIDLNSGLTVVTGQTGAGKSIMLDAIQLGLARAPILA